MRKFYAATLKAITTLAVIFGVLIFNTVSAQLVYCTSTSTSTNYEYINSINSGTFTNNSGRSNYANYTSMGVMNMVAQGSTFTITVNITNYASGDKVYVFADWNQDGDFDDPGEASGTATFSSGTTGVAVSVPADAFIGNTTLRIKMGFTGAGGIRMDAQPCQTFTYGEVEDYLINVYTAATITTGTIDPLSFCAGSTVAVPFTTSGTFAGGNIFTAQLSDAAGNFTSPVNIGTGSSPITATIPTSTATGTGYRIRVVSSSPAVNGDDNGSNITINALPAAPTGSATQSFCSTSNPAIADLTPGGASIKWYGAATGGTSLASTTALTDGTSYYASQTNGSGCESSARLQVTAIVSTQLTSVSYGTNPVIYCAGAAIAPNNPTVAGGIATSYSVTPGLPGGLSLNTTTGVISGTPTATDGAAAADYTVTASNSCGSVTVPVNITISPAAPSALTYTDNTPTYCAGTAIPDNSPSNSGGVATSYSVSPALPNGLSLDPVTGIISGTPTATGSGTYTVTAGNSCGTTFKDLVITITSPPTGVSYGTNPVVYCAGAAIAPNSPTVTGGAATSFAANSLPAGLTINETTGVISGTPTATGGVAATDYTVTASNDCGLVSVPVNITISPAAPSALTYTLLTPNYCVGTPIASNNPSSSGGPATSYSVSPALPNGLSLDPATGIISGTPTVAGSGTYIVTATNSCGSTTKGLEIAISSPPTGISYGTNPVVYCAGTAIAPNSPTVTGGAATSFTAGSLPAGLTINATTGAISGTPTATGGVPATDFTITASNDCGFVTVPVNITISPAAPSALTYTDNTPTYCAGTAISDNSPSNTGGAATSYSVSPALPSGLSLDVGTGIISGTPSVAGSATYTVTASNSCGNSTKGITITINPAASITDQPTNQITCAGTGKPFTVTATGTSPTYQWQYSANGTTGWGNVTNGAPANTTYSGGTASTLTVTPSTTAANSINYYRCVVTVSGCSPSLNSSTATLTVSATPTTANAGTAQTLCTTTTSTTLAANTPVNGTGAWSVTSGPSTALSQFSDVNNPAAIFTPAAGAGTYALKWTISNGPCTASSSSVNIVVNTAPSISDQPTNQITCAGTGKPFTVTATGTSPTYQWQYSANGAGGWANVTSGTPANTTYSGGTSATLTVTPSTTAAAGINYYRCIVSVNSCSSVTSSSATLTVNVSSKINLTSGSGTDGQTLCQNTPLAPITYAISGGATSASLSAGSLPTGVTGGFSSGVFTISGTPTVSGNFSYTVKASGPCADATLSGTISVTAGPTGTLNVSATTICAGQPVIFTFSNATYGSYIFKLNGAGAPLQTGTSNVYSTSTLNDGDFIAVNVANSNNCGATFTSAPVTVKAVPAATLTASPSSTTICAGDPILFTAAPTGAGFNFNFKVDGVTQQSGNSNTYTNTTLTDGQGIAVWVTNAIGCTSISDTIIYTVNPLPNGTLTNTTPKSICPNTDVSFQATGGVSYQFRIDGVIAQAWSSSSTFTHNFSDDGVVTVDVANGPNGTGCTKTYTPGIPVTVNPLPTGNLDDVKENSGVINDKIICQGSPVKYTFSTTGYTSYEFFINTTSKQKSSSNVFSTTELAQGDQVSVIITTTNGCTETFTAPAVTVIDAPAVMLTVDPGNTICFGDNATFTSSVSDPAFTYNFKVDGVSQQNSAGVNTFSTTSLTAGTHQVTVDVSNSNGCITTSNTVTITVNPLPTGTLTAVENYGTPDDGVICEGGTVVFTVPAGFSNYNFLLNGVSVQNGASNTYPNSTLVTGDKITVAITGAGGCIAVLNTITITVNPLPVVAAIQGPDNVCIDGTVTLADATNTPAGVWSSMNIAVADVDPVSGVVTGKTAGTVLIVYTYTNDNGCSSAVNKQITVNAPPVVAVITGNFNVCNGFTSQLSDATSGGVWSSGNTNVATIDASTGVVTGVAIGTSVISYTYTDANGCSTTVTATVTVTDLPTVAAITTTSPSGFNVCVGGSLQLKDGTTGGSWSSSDISKATVNAAGVVSGIAGGTVDIMYTITTSCGQNATTTQTITVNAPPSATIAYSGSPYCTNAGPIDVTATGTTGGTFAIAPTTGGVSIDPSTGTITPGTVGGNYTVTYTVAASGGCAVYTTTANVTITTAPAATIAYAGLYCTTSASAAVTRTGTAGGTYSYTGAGTLAINATTGTINPSGSDPGDYVVTYTVNAAGCAPFSTTANVTITKAPSGTFSYGGSPYCTTSGTVNITNNGLTPGGTFSAPGGLTINAASGTITPATSTGGTYTVTYKILASGGCGDFTTTASVTIAAAPTAVAGTAIQTCANTGAVNITAGASAANYSSVVWTSSGTGIFTNPNSLTGATYQPGATDINAGSVTLTLTVNPNSPCAAAAVSTKVLTISPVTPVTSVTADPSTICLGSSSNLFVPSGTTNLISENFETGAAGSFTVVSTGSNQPASSWTNRTSTYTYYYNCIFGFCFNQVSFNSGSKFMLANSDEGGGSTNTALVSPAVPTTGYTSLTLSYRTYYEASSGENGYVEVSTNGGTTWTTVRTLSNTIGSQGNFSPQTFSLNAYINLPSVMVRFRYSGNNGAWWAIDDVKLTGTSTPENYSWTATPAATAGLPANSGTPSQSNANIVVTPTAVGSYTYTAILTNAAGCTSTKDVAVSVNPIPSVSIITDYCSIPNKVLLTAIATPGATLSWNTGKTTDTIQVDVAGAYTVTATFGGCSATATSTVATELVNNGAFTNGNDGSFLSDYAYHADVVGNNELVDDSGNNGYSITTNGQNVHSNFWGKDHTNNATGPRNFMAVNGHSDIITVWKQTVSVLPNTKYYFSAWAMSLNNVSPFAQLRFSVGGTPIGTTAVLAGHGQSNSATDNWVRFYGDWTSGPTTTSVVISIVDLQAAAGGNDFGLDDISFGTLSTFITLISPEGTDAQTVCKNSAIANIVYNVGNGSVNPPTVTGLPAGITSNFAGNTLTFTGTPTVAGNYSYTITTATTAGCAPSTATGTITVLEDSIKLTSGSTAPVCKDVLMPSLVYTVGGTATGASITAGALPAGVTGVYDPATKTFTISGTPTDPAGTYNYTVTTSGANCPGTAASRTGTITIQAQSITLTSAPATANQTKCINTAITNLQYTVSGTATGATVTGLPNGVTGQYQSGIFTIKGTPTEDGTFNYEVTTSGNCTSVTAQGTITVTPAATISLTSGSGTDAQTLCTGVAITPIVYTVTNATGASIIAGAYPAGITGIYDPTAGTYTISGTPTETVGKAFNYTVGTSGGCASDSKTGSITVTAQTVALSNGNASQTVCQGADMSPIVYTISGFAQGATVEGLPNGMSGALSNGNTKLTITGSTTDPAGTYNYTVRTTGSQCGEATATGTITISAAAVGGTVAGTASCSGGSGTLTLLGNSTNPIRWESSITNSAPWTTIANTTVTLNYSNVTVGTYYRAVVGNGCGNVYSDVAYVGIHNLWTGATSTDWNDASNWSDGKVPSTSCNDVYIPGGSPHQPTLSSGTATIINLHIASGATLTVDNATMEIKGTISNVDPGAFNASNGTLNFSGSTTQSIKGSDFDNRTIENLIVSNSDLKIASTAGDTLKISGEVSFGTASAKLTTGDNLTLLSTKDHTASIGVLGAGNAVSGQVEVERYINIGTTAGTHAKTWQFLATPTQGQTLKQSWMENGSTLSTGYGAQFTGTTGTTGYDGSSVAPSVKFWDENIGNWTEFANTGDQLYEPRGYFAFIRGDRSVGPSDAAKPTTLRSKGSIFTGDKNIPVPQIQTSGNVFFSIGNPYPSAVDMTQVRQTGQGITDPHIPFIYVWSPLLNEGYGVGGWSTYTFIDGQYENTNGEPVDGILQSGQAFLIQEDASVTTTVSFTEGGKVSSSSNIAFREQTEVVKGARLITNLFSLQSDGNTILADGTLQMFDKSYSGKLDRYDAKKIMNSANNLAINTSGENLVVERRAPLTEQDTIQYNMSSMAKQNYRLEFKALGLSSENVEGFVEDTYLDTRTPLNMEGTTHVDFAVTSDKGSYAANRFRIVFKTAVVLPVKFVSITAVQKDEDIEVTWKTENEKAVKQYDVEKSVDGVSYKKAYTVAADNNGAGSYNWLDEQAIPGDNYYRIRMEDESGKISYSDVVKVSIPLGKPSIGIYPNPITDGIIHLQFVNQPKGRYGLRLLNPLGQTIIAKQVEHAGGNATENIKWDYNLAHGVYQLQVLKPDGKIQVIKVMY